ncbi:MAG: cadherin-like beta sandwich domain-containing protein, partial [Rhodospirillaceae bacterium]|nr:cadherin-like beta sandwich domain-containing protein [Rhodospirillaceae bacterium]
MFRRRASRGAFGADAVAVRSLAAFLCAAAVANAASADILLSNLDESNDAGLVVGTPVDTPTVKAVQAIRFETGDSERGYNLTSVKAVLANAAASDGVRVRIFNARSNGNPYYSLYTLTNPTISDGTLTFTAPASATLQHGTRYFVMFDLTASGAGNDYEVRGTESDSLNSQAVGWSLNTEGHVGKTPESLFWSTHDEVPLVEISGDALVQANDANLSALSIDDGNSTIRTSYSPRFDPSMTSYTSTAAYLIDRITINASPANADGAEVAYLDGDGQLLTDADADTEGFQVDLEVGANTIGVQVTAENGTTTRTYTMVVTREESRVAADALASNLAEHFSKRFYVGNLEPGKTLRAQALGFETGGNEAGYVLTSVKIFIWEITHSAGVRVRVFNSTAEGNPGSSLYTLSGSVVLPTTDLPPGEDSPASTFEAPANATLESNTRYFVVIDSRSSQLYRFYKIWGTLSDNISKVADGWSMNNFRHTGIRDTGVWETADEVPFVEVAGHAVVPSSDATLTGLGLTWDDGGTATDIALNPVFNASTTSYTASVANGVDRITIAGAKSDSGARVDYFDGTDTALTDADGNAAGFQVNLGVGANTIKAKVAASDGETTQTYTVVVTRAAGDTTAPAATGATVNGAFTVKKTPSGGSETTVALTSSPTISGATVTLTLATAVVSTDAVTVSYTPPTSGTANTLQDAAGNQVASFTDRTVTNDTAAQATLTASFENGPDEHDGTSVFTLELAFSEAVFDGTEEFDKNQAIQDAVQVTDGTVAGRRRVAPNLYDRWILRIRPSGDGDVTVRLPATTGSCNSAGAICTLDDRPLSAPASATIEGPSAEAPDAPSAPTLTVGETWVEASWTAPADNGATITGYDVHYRETGGNWLDANHTGTGTTKRITGLTADT